MVAFMRVSISLVKSMALVYTLGMTDHAMMESGLRTKLEVQEHTHGLMDVNIKENGSTTTWKAWASTLGRMEDVMRVNIETIRSMVTEFTHGLITECIKACGSEVNSTDLDTIQSLEVIPRLAFGKMANGLNGLIMKLFKRFSLANLISRNTSKRALKVLKMSTTTQKEMILGSVSTNPWALMRDFMK